MSATAPPATTSTRTAARMSAGVASALWYAVLAFLGHQVADNWEGVKTLVADTNRALGIGTVVFAAVAGVWLWRRARRRAG